MAGRILILDSVATNRIVLKVKMKAAQYDVDSCGSHKEAEDLIQSRKPDLLLINMTDPIEDRHAFCRSLRQNPETASIGIICVGVADTTRARFAAIDCGADDVLPRPISDPLMMARIRNILRHRNIGLEWQLRDGTRRALGFEETAAPLLRPANAFVVSQHKALSNTMGQRINRALRQEVPVIAPRGTLHESTLTETAELLIIDGTSKDADAAELFQLIAELQTRPATREAALIAILPANRDDMASMALDLGADDVVFETICSNELELRLNTLTLRKAQRDQMNDTVRNGLNAAVTDPLTGLFNRRYAEMHLVQIAKQSRKTGHDYALMVIDIDHFKAVNDTYGHQAGDEVLKSLSSRIRDNLRPIDLLARIGGEEFLIVMPATSDDLARLAADRLRRLINDEPFKIGRKHQPLPVTISVGVAVDRVEQPQPESSTLIDRADAALYCAKTSGRNMVSMSKEAA